MHGGDTTADGLAEGLARRLGAVRAWVVAGDGVRDAARAALGDARAEVVGVLGSVPLRCADVRALGAGARARGRACVVDNTLPTSHGCPAVRLGAHLSLEALGEGCVCVAVSGDAARALPGLWSRLDALRAPTDARLAALCRADADGARRHRRGSDAAAVVAAYLSCHPRVSAVRYPGLRGDPSFEVAARTLVGGFGPVLDYATKTDPQAWVRLSCPAADPLRLLARLEEDLRRPRQAPRGPAV